MSTIHSPAADVQWRADEFAYSKCLGTDCGANDIHDSIDRPYLVEVDLLDGDVVNLGFCYAELVKDGDGGTRG